MNIINQTSQWKRLLADLYSGHKGTFLTAYLPMPGAMHNYQWRNQIESVVANAERLMKRNHSPEDIEAFVKPVRRLANETHLLETSGKGGWVIFRSESQFRLKRLHMKMEPLSVVSSSFHIKPLLKWWENTENYYVLNINSEEACVYERTNSGLKEIDSIPTLGGPLYSWMDTWVLENLEDLSKPVVLSGEQWAIKSFLENSQMQNIFPRSVVYNGMVTNTKDLLEEVEDCLIEEVMELKHYAKKDLMDASKAGLASFDIHRIAKMIVSGNVSKLYIAEDAHAWGLFNPKTGDLKLHNNQLDCRDDDVLDDFAELAMKKGVEIFLLPKADIPAGSSVAAIFKANLHPYNAPTPTLRLEHVAS